MSIILKKHKTENYYITMEFIGHYGGYYLVSVYPLFENGLVGYPVRELTYSLSEKQKAYNTFRRYCKTYI